MTLNFRNEPSVRAWAWRALVGPSSVIDGAVLAVTLGTLNIGLALAVARRLAQARFAFDSSKLKI